MPCRPTNWPALDHLSHHLFEHPRDVPAPSAAVRDSLDRCEIVAAAGVQDEIVELARHIKRELTSRCRGGPRPATWSSCFAIYARQPRGFATCSTSSASPIRSKPAGRSRRPTVVRLLLDLLRLDAENWPFRRVVSLVTNNQLAVAERRDAPAAEWLLRDLQIDRGREQLLERVTALSALAATNSEIEHKSSSHPRTHLDRQAQAAASALPFLSNSPPPWTNSADGRHASDGSPPWPNLPTNLMLACLTTAAADPENSAAWRAITEHLLAGAIRHVARRAAAPQLSRRELLDVLVDLAQHESLPRRHDDVGRVRVLSAADGPHRRRPSTFSWPACRSRRSPRPSAPADLLPTPTTASSPRAADQDAPPPPNCRPSTRSQDEMLLFYEVLTRAEESLTISYPALDDKAQELPPSPYVTEIERSVRRRQQIEHRACAAPLSPVPTGGTPLERDRLAHPSRRMSAREDRDLGLLAGLFRASRQGSLPAPLECRPADRSRPRHARIVRPGRGPARQPRRRRPSRAAVRPASTSGAPANGKRTPPARTSSSWSKCST